MSRKLHLYDLPVFDMPLEYSRDSNRLAISIPMFTSVKSKPFGLFGSDSMFSLDRFDDLVVRSGAWSALSILTNTDLGEHGVPLYFHVEDVVYDRVVSILSEYGIPEAWIRPTTFPEFPHADELKMAQTGKKLAIFADDGIDADVCMVWDTDAFVYRHPGGNALEWYQHYIDGGIGTECTLMSHKYRNDVGTLLVHVNHCRAAVGLLPVDESLDMMHDFRGLLPYLREAFERVDLDIGSSYEILTLGGAIISVPRLSDLCGFIKKYHVISYIDDRLISMYHSVKDKDLFFTLGAIGPQIALTDGEMLKLSYSAVVHPRGVDRNVVARYRPRLLKCIDGRNFTVS